MADGLFDGVIHSIVEDAAGRLWMNTNRGIFWVARAQLVDFAEGRIRAIHSTAYTERDGLRDREGNGGSQNAGLRTRDGRIWFPTQDGVAIVDSARAQRNRVVPQVALERINVGGRTIALTRASVALGTDQRDLEIHFTALSFLAPANMRFRYRLDPYDRDWVDAGNRRTAFYAHLPPGHYTFRVIASNNDGVWNRKGASVGLTIAPFFWERTSFRLAG